MAAPQMAHAQRTRAPLVVACLAQAMVVLDISVINVALPQLREALGFTPAAAQWVSNAYLLAFGGLLLLGGRWADLVGVRRAFLVGLSGFALASAVGGLASGPAVLVAARAGQGVAAAVLAPATLTLVTTTHPEGPLRDRALASWTAVSVAGGAVGNLAGGVLTSALSWRATLLINVPLGAIALVLAARALAPVRAARVRLDLPGAVLVTVGFAALAHGFALVRRPAPAAEVVAAFGAAAVVLVAFALVERRSPRPLLPPDLLAHRGVLVGNGVMALTAATFQTAKWFFLTLYMQNVLHYTPLQAGLGFLPHTLVSVVVLQLVTPRLMRQVPLRVLIASGLLLAAAGFVWQSGVSPDSGYVGGILLPAVVFSAGGGLFNAPLTAVVTSGVAEGQAGAASGLMNTTKQFGGALGLAALVALAGTPAGFDYSAVFLVGAGFLLAAAALAALLPGRCGEWSREPVQHRGSTGERWLRR